MFTLAPKAVDVPDGDPGRCRGPWSTLKLPQTLVLVTACWRLPCNAVQISCSYEDGNVQGPVTSTNQTCQPMSLSLLFICQVAPRQGHPRPHGPVVACISIWLYVHGSDPFKLDHLVQTFGRVRGGWLLVMV